MSDTQLTQPKHLGYLESTLMIPINDAPQHQM